MHFSRPRPLIALVTLLFVVLTISLGMWQVGRASAKQQLAKRFAVADTLAPTAWQGQLGDSAWQHRYLVRGQWLPEAMIFLDNRVLDAKAGFYALLPLQLANGHVLLVNAGWYPKPAPGARLDMPVLPKGNVELLVRLQAPAQHYVQLAPDAATVGTIWQNLDWIRYQAMVAKPLVPAMAIAQTSMYGISARWPAPDFGVEKHYAYAGQWFLFALVAVFFFVKLHWKRP